MKVKPLKFDEATSDQAHADWKATCGPHTLAAALGLSLDEVRPAIPNYRGWMSPTQMQCALTALNVSYERMIGNHGRVLCEGINRIQLEGDWLKPGVPARVAYFHTHWVAMGESGPLDWVLCTVVNRLEWVPIFEWLREFDTEGPWHVTHHYVIR